MDNNNCLICFENVTMQQCVICIRCNIVLHKTCEKQWRGEKGHTKCPHCQKIGVMGCFLKNIYT